MSHVPHELAEDFPGMADRIHELKRVDGHFSNLADRYHVVNRAIHRAEIQVEPVSDMAMQEMRRERMSLKDEIAGYLRTAEEA